MQNFIEKMKQKYGIYFEPKAINLIEKCLVISCITCLLSVFLLCFSNTYFTPHFLYHSTIIIYRTGVMIGLFPFAFVLVIQKWKKEH